MRNHRYMLAIIFVILGILSIQPSARTYAASSDPGLSHCTDWNVAKVADPSRPVATQDIDKEFDIYDIGNADLFSVGWLIPSEETQRDSAYRWKAPNWRVLIRPGGTFAVFYSTLSTNMNNRINDPDPNTQTFYDADSDGVPDYVERIYSCLEKSHRGS